MNAQTQPATAASMKARRPVSPDHLMFMVLLVLLAFIAVILWFKDPAHRYSGESRVGWPPSAPAKP